MGWRAGILALLWLPGSAQESPETLILQKLHAKLADAFAPLARRDRVINLVLVNPGIPVTLLPEGAKASLEDQFLLSNLLNTVPPPTWTFSTGTLTVPSVYKTLLDFGQVPKNGLPDPVAVRQLRDAWNLLYTRRNGFREPSDTYRSYLKFQHAYYSAQDAQESVMVDCRNRGLKPPANLDGPVKAALQDWETKGYRSDIGKALAAIQANFDKDLAVGFGNCRKNFDEQKVTLTGSGGNYFYRTQTEPSFEQWASAQGWVDWSFQDQDTQSQPLRESSATKGSTPTPTLLLSKGAFRISAHIQRVEILRPWLDQELLRSRTWKLANSCPFKALSSGQATGDPGVMPYLPTALLLAKDLEISGNWSRQELEKMASGSGTIGPFALGGSKVKVTLVERAGSLSLKADGVQVIGYLCEVLPKSPNPDPSFVFSD